VASCLLGPRRGLAAARPPLAGLAPQTPPGSTSVRQPERRTPLLRGQQHKSAKA
jgi:hypothetical protein